MSLSQRTSGKKSALSNKKSLQKEVEEEKVELTFEDESDVEDDGEGESIPIQTFDASASLNQKRKPVQAWEDPDDQEVEMDISSVARLRKLRKNQEETVITGEEYQDRLKEYYNNSIKTSHFYDWTSKKVEVADTQGESYLDSLLKTNTSILESNKSQGLPRDILKLTRAAAIPLENRHSSVIQALDFHKNNETLLSAGLDKTIKIFNISKVLETNKFELRPVKSIFTKNLPILTAKFNGTYNEIIATGQRKYILGFDLVKETFEKSAPSFITARLQNKVKSFSLSHDDQTIAIYGHNQYMMMVSAKTKQLLFELRLNSEISACSFSPDDKYLFATTEDGSIYQWDLNMRRVVEVFHDQGSMKTTCVDFSQDGSFLASGNSTGIANLYSFNKMTRTLEKNVTKEVGNLTTSLDNVKFNPTGEMLAITSRWKRNAIRILHVPTQTVFSNWPNMRTKLSYINRVCFSDNSRYLAIGNDIGNVIVYNFEHFEA